MSKEYPYRLFYQTYSERLPRGHNNQQIHHKACDVLDDLSLAVYLDAKAVGNA